jgi:hypothetical protein
MEQDQIVDEDDEQSIAISPSKRRNRNSILDEDEYADLPELEDNIEDTDEEEYLDTILSLYEEKYFLLRILVRL